MAESKKNIVTHGLSGKVGDLLVFSQRNGKTIVSQAPVRTAEATEKQKEHFAKFQQAVIYAKRALQDPAVKADYAAAARDGISPYNLAVADLMQAPNIEEIDLSSYTGKVGDTISVKVTDDFKVAEVAVSIYNEDSSLVEKGQAVIDNTGLHWIYTATEINANIAGDKIVVQASDMPGNISLKESAVK